MERKWTTYDEDFWETCPGEIIDMNSSPAEAAGPAAQSQAGMCRGAAAEDNTFS